MKLLFESWRKYLIEGDNPIISNVNNIPMYRGTRFGDPNVRPSGTAYFISNKIYAKTYGDVGEFRLNIQNPKIVDRETWVNSYDTMALRMNPSTLDDLRQEGYDSVAMEADTAMGPMYTVMVLDAERSVQSPGTREGRGLPSSLQSIPGAWEKFETSVGDLIKNFKNGEDFVSKLWNLYRESDITYIEASDMMLNIVDNNLPGDIDDALLDFITKLTGPSDNSPKEETR